MVSAPLTRFLKKNIRFQCSQEEEHTYQYLKNALTSTPLLAYPDWQQVQILTTHASSKGISAILSQALRADLQNEKVISYNSRTLRDAERNYATVNLEALAIVWGVSEYRHYLIENFFYEQIMLPWFSSWARPNPVQSYQGRRLLFWNLTMM